MSHPVVLPPLPSEERLSALGARMRRIRSRRPQVSWLQGPGPVDLWTWVDDAQRVVEQEFTFCGRTVVFRRGQLLTGRCLEGSEASDAGRDNLLDFDLEPDPETLAAARTLAHAIPAEARGDDTAHLLNALDA